MIASKDAKPYSFSPTYFNYWNEKQPKLKTLKPKQYKKLCFDVLETKEQGKFGNYAVKSYIQSKELYPLIVLLKGFEPRDKIAFEWNKNDYELDALVCGIGVGIGIEHGIGIRVGIRVSVPIGIAVGVGIDIQNNDPYYIENFKWKEFQEIFEQSGEQYCLYDCLVFPEIDGKPIRTLLPWFMMKEVEK